jgi:transposase
MYQEIINDHLFPFVANKFQYKAKLHQDNDSKHTSAICRNALENLKIRWIKSPPKSPDLNPIEWVWADLKRHVRKKFCSSQEEVIMAVKEFWLQMTPMYCGNFINHLKKVSYDFTAIRYHNKILLFKVIKEVIKKHGEWSNH